MYKNMIQNKQNSNFWRVGSLADHYYSAFTYLLLLVVCSAAVITLPMRIAAMIRAANGLPAISDYGISIGLIFYLIAHASFWLVCIYAFVIFIICQRKSLTRHKKRALFNSAVVLLATLTVAVGVYMVWVMSTVEAPVRPFQF